MSKLNIKHSTKAERLNEIIEIGGIDTGGFQKRYRWDIGTDLPITKLRWYQNIGLIAKPQRCGKYAYYMESDYKNIIAVHFLNNFCGYTIQEILTLERLGTDLSRAVKSMSSELRAILVRNDENDLWVTEWSRYVNDYWAEAVARSGKLRTDMNITPKR